MAASRAPTSGGGGGGGFEENAMAILDSSGIKDSRDLHDDRAAFLEAVRSTCLAADNHSPPSWRMYDAVFQILRKSCSLELVMGSFQLLVELDKQYPRAYLTNSSGDGALVVVKEAWSPFLLGSAGSDHFFDSSGFYKLIEDMNARTSTTDLKRGIKPAESMLLFQYLVSTLEADFIPHHIVYKETSNWVVFRESMLNMLLVSGRHLFKALVKNCISLSLKLCHHEEKDGVEDMVVSSEEASAKSAYDSKFSIACLISELERRTLVSLQKLLVLVMNLDLIRKDADSLGLTSRTDGLRNPIMEVILEELIYREDYRSPFLLAFTEPRLKLEIILQYFSKYCTMPAVRTRRSDTSPKHLTLESVLSFFSTATRTKAIVKKIAPEVALLLLAHAYQVCLSLQHDVCCMDYSTKRIGATLLQISNNFMSAFQNLRILDQDMAISSFEREALFTAATLVRKLRDE